MGGCRDVGDFLQQGKILGIAAEFIIADQGAVGRPAESPVFFFVDLFKEGALIELRRFFEILSEFLLADVQHAKLQHDAGFRLHHQIVQPAPRPLELLKFRRMHDGVQLRRQQPVNVGDAGTDGRFQVFRHPELALHHLIDERRNLPAGLIPLPVVFPDAGLADDLIEHPTRFYGGGFGGLCLGLLCVLSHWIPPSSLPGRFLCRSSAGVRYP